MKMVLLGRYNPSEKLTGPEKFAKRLYHNLLEQKIECEFIEYFFDGKEFTVFQKLFGKEEIDCEHVKVYRLGVFQILIFLIKNRVRFIHLVTYERFQIVAFLYSIFFKTSILFSLHGFVNFENHTLDKRKVPLTLKLKDSIFENIFLFYSDIIQIPSLQYKTKFLQMNKRLKESKVVVIHNGCDFNELITIKKQAKPSIGTLKAVFVGDDVRQEKGLQFLLQNIDLLSNYLEIFIVGEHFKNVDLYSDNFHVIEKMEHEHFINFLADKELILSFSYYDLFPIAIIEGAVVGLLPIVTKETGLSDLFIENKIGFVFNYGDINELERILNNINDDRGVIEKHIREKNKLKFLSWENITKQFLQIYENCNK